MSLYIKFAETIHCFSRSFTVQYLMLKHNDYVQSRVYYTIKDKNIYLAEKRFRRLGITFVGFEHLTVIPSKSPFKCFATTISKSKKIFINGRSMYHYINTIASIRLLGVDVFITKKYAGHGGRASLRKDEFYMTARALRHRLPKVLMKYIMLMIADHTGEQFEYRTVRIIGSGDERFEVRYKMLTWFGKTGAYVDSRYFDVITQCLKIRGLPVNVIYLIVRRYITADFNKC